MWPRRFRKVDAKSSSRANHFLLSRNIVFEIEGMTTPLAAVPFRGDTDEL